MLSAETNKKKIAFHTLGCKLNFAETSTMSRAFPPEQFERVPANSIADIYVINTCSVTDAADRKCRQAIKKFIHRSPDAFIAVVGCYAQLKPQEISSIPGVDLVLGTNEKFDIAGYLTNIRKKAVAEVHSCDLTDDDKFFQSSSVSDRTRSFLKVQDGCDYSCSYCTIPMARGKSRNPEINSVISEAQLLGNKGVKEVVLTGVNIGDFGKTTGDSFENLLRELVRINGIERYRISSIEPNLLTDSILDLASSEKKILPHFHIPLQSGCNRILGLMRRRYRREVFSDLVMKIKEKIPFAGIGADVIVGFPGETQKDFDDTYAFLSELPLSYLHVFTYSERPGTVAAGMDGKVRHTDKVIRSKQLISLSERKHREFCILNAGSEADVLFENNRIGNLMTGFTGNYIRVEHPWQSKMAGKIIRVRLLESTTDGNMKAEIIEKI